MEQHISLPYPTIRTALELYPRFAETECVKRDRPCETTVGNHLFGLRRLCHIGGIGLDETVDTLTLRRLEDCLVRARREGLAVHTASSYLSSLRGVFARWTHLYWQEAGWRVPMLEMPICRRSASRYLRQDPQTLRRLKEWYRELESHGDRREWVVVTLMLEFAMRNGDVARLRWNDFREYPQNGQSVLCLCYTPHKTALTSGSRVIWPVHPDIWRELVAYREAGEPFNVRRGWQKNRARNVGLVVPNAGPVMNRLNGSLRERGIFTGTKGLYELRKVCIDHVYRKYGAEMAASISGDDIRTITRYYADPSAVNIIGRRITDLF